MSGVTVQTMIASDVGPPEVSLLEQHQGGFTGDVRGGRVFIGNVAVADPRYA